MPDRNSKIRPLGRTGLSVSAVTAGGGPLGSMPQVFGYEVDAEDGINLVQEIFRSDIRSIDTANGYSNGESERRIGEAIDRFGGLPADFLITTKTDPLGNDYSGARVRASVDESRRRLGMEFLPMVYIHEPEAFSFEELTAPGGCVDTLCALRDEGVVGHIGVAGGDVHIMRRYLDLGVFEVILVHNRWTLVDHSAEELIHAAEENGVAFVNAAIYGGGILADPYGTNRNYGYRPASEAVLTAVTQMADLAESYGTDLGSVALAASLQDPLVTTTVVGFSKPSRLESIAAASELQLPEAFWSELETLVPAREHWLDFQTVS